MNPRQSQALYRERIALAVAAIVREPLADHTLHSLAALAHFSPFHFHRVYLSVTGETVAATIRRVRLAQATRQLVRTEPSVTRIGQDAGYDSPQAFSRAFRQFAGASPLAFRQRLQAGPVVSLETLPALHIHALRHVGPPATIAHTQRRLRLLLGQTPVRARLGLAWGDPEQGEDFVYYAGAELATPLPPTPDVQTLSILPGLYAVHTLTGPYTQIGAAISALYATWLPQSGYEPENRPVLEHYLNSPRDTALAALQTRLMIPVRALGALEGAGA
ncbi:AraC family transcriptional regulator [Silvimonas iriomotensis]|uniref:AraC family transcriptional regulator n=1 Tax=Silvimonas iriomotensis TaxID=449662 RepID=A0ABQ2P8R7_9NEIS|nr:GyrI-like domain-containing protein [Silvimonas iriomotensis]GGP21087.1 AraC family transcriptional regulator [Silvimonas iriomotensis]